MLTVDHRQIYKYATPPLVQIKNHILTLHLFLKGNSSVMLRGGCVKYFPVSQLEFAVDRPCNYVSDLDAGQLARRNGPTVASVSGCIRVGTRTWSVSKCSRDPAGREFKITNQNSTYERLPSCDDENAAFLLLLGAVHNCQHLCIRTERTNSQTPLPPTQICTFKCWLLSECSFSVSKGACHVNIPLSMYIEGHHRSTMSHVNGSI